MKNNGFLAIVAVLLAFLTSGCATRSNRSSGWGRLSSIAVPPILTVVLTNNMTIPVEVYENGQPVSFKDKTGQYHNAMIPSGGTVSRGYYNFLGRRDIVITVRGICPPTPVESDVKATGCAPGQYAGTATRRFYLYTDGQYHSDHWEINYLRGPRGVN